MFNNSSGKNNNNKLEKVKDDNNNNKICTIEQQLHDINNSRRNNNNNNLKNISDVSNNKSLFHINSERKSSQHRFNPFQKFRNFFRRQIFAFAANQKFFKARSSDWDVKLGAQGLML